MELLELLDKIDDTAPVDCRTCLHMATHEKCDNCLTLPGDYQLDPRPPNRYLNHEPGNWMRQVQSFENDGRRNIVIGGSGEAEVNMLWSPSRTSKHLHSISEQCGYMTGRLKSAEADTAVSLEICTSAGWFRIYWDTTNRNEGGKLYRIDRLNNDHEVEGQSWPSF